MADKQICPYCKGKGEIIKIDCLDAVFTMGLTALMDLSEPKVCPVCKGKGVIE